MGNSVKHYLPTTLKNPQKDIEFISIGHRIKLAGNFICGSLTIYQQKFLPPFPLLSNVRTSYHVRNLEKVPADCIYPFEIATF